MKRAMTFVCLVIALCVETKSETIDRLAITVGKTVITELEIDEELRITALLNNQAVSFDIASRRTAADRLVNQQLIDHEMEFSHYPPPSASEVNAYYARVEETLGGATQLAELLAKSQLSRETLRMHLRSQLSTLRFVEIRFRPDASVSDSEIDAAYKNEQARFRTANPKVVIPPLDDDERNKLSSLLLEERTDAALSSWLAQGRKQADIVYVDSTLQ